MSIMTRLPGNEKSTGPSRRSLRGQGRFARARYGKPMRVPGIDSGKMTRLALGVQPAVDSFQDRDGGRQQTVGKIVWGAVQGRVGAPRADCEHRPPDARGEAAEVLRPAEGLLRLEDLDSEFFCPAADERYGFGVIHQGGKGFLRGDRRGEIRDAGGSLDPLPDGAAEVMERFIAR